MNTLVWISIVFSPLFDMGIVVRADQLLCPLVFVFCLMAHRGVAGRNSGTRAIVVYALVSALASMTGTVAAGSIDIWRPIKWPLLFLTNIVAAYCIVWTSRPKQQSLYETSLRLLQVLLFFVGLIGLLQVAEHRRLIPTTLVTDFLATAYPYQGELTDVAYQKAFGNQLKVGSVGQLTSVVDGHPILAGDLLAFCLIITMPLVGKKKGWILHGVPVIALMLTVSRASIVPWFFGVMVYYFLVLWHSPRANKPLRKLGMQLAGLAAILGLVMITPLGETILWRIEGTLDTFHGIGASDGRTERVWPAVLAELESSTAQERVFGLNDVYDGPTDSQYLFTLVNHGVVGLIALLAVHLLLMVRGYKYSMGCIRTNRPPELAFAYIAAVSGLLVMYIAHPTFQNRRLLSIIVIATVLIFHTAHRRRVALHDKDVDREIQGGSPLRAAPAG